MPEISRFFGIVIRMYFREHGIPHFHAEYGEHKATISIETLSILARGYTISRVWPCGRVGFHASRGTQRSMVESFKASTSDQDCTA